MRGPGWSVDACSLGLFFFSRPILFFDVPMVFFCDPVVNWCFGRDKGSGNRTPNVLWDVKVSRVRENRCIGFMLSFYS